MTRHQAEIGVFGGSGFYSLVEGADPVEVATPYGPPSDLVTLGEIAGRRVAFLPRHGAGHTIPPHRINYRANVWALKELGVTRLISPCACGSLQPEVAPGHFVICDQVVNRTWGRPDTYYDGPVATHVSFADPYCPELRPIAARVAGRLGITVHEAGTMVVIQGPRFTTRAESAAFSREGWHVVNMTQYPEVILARELEICCVNISLVTDYDAGVQGQPAVTAAEIVRIFQQNNERLRALLFELLPAVPASRSCPCGSALEGAQL